MARIHEYRAVKQDALALRREDMRSRRLAMYGPARTVRPSKRPLSKTVLAYTFGRFVHKLLGVRTFDVLVDVYDAAIEARGRWFAEFGGHPTENEMAHVLTGWWPCREGDPIDVMHGRLYAEGRVWQAVRRPPHGR